MGGHYFAAMGWWAPLVVGLLLAVAARGNESQDDPSLHHDYKSQYSSIRYKTVLAGLRNASSAQSEGGPEKLRSLVVEGRLVVDNLRFGEERPEQAEELEKAVEQVEATLATHKLDTAAPRTELLQQELTATRSSIDQLLTLNLELKHELNLRHTEYENKGHLRQQLKHLTGKIRKTRTTISTKRREMVRALEGLPLPQVLRGSAHTGTMGEGAPKTSAAVETKAKNKLEIERQKVAVKLADKLQVCMDSECVLNAKLTNAKALRALAHEENSRLLDALREADGAVGQDIGRPITDLTENLDRMQGEEKLLDENIEHAIHQNKVDAKLQDMLKQESERRAMLDVSPSFNA